MSSEPAGPDDVAFGYVVANPYGLPKGERILSWEEQEWFEGDIFAPADMPADMVDWLIDEGVVVPARRRPNPGRED